MMIGRPIGDFPTPEQWEAIDQKNFAITQQQQARAKISPAKLLQNALKALGVANGDSKLSKLKVDGVIGAGTAKAATYAFATYLNAPNTMSAAYVRQHVTYLTNQVTAYVQEHGGVVPPVHMPVYHSAAAIITPPIPTSPTSSGFSTDPKYIYYGIAGLSVLLLLASVAHATRRPSAPAAA